MTLPDARAWHGIARLGQASSDVIGGRHSDEQRAIISALGVYASSFVVWVAGRVIYFLVSLAAVSQETRVLTAVVRLRGVRSYCLARGSLGLRHSLVDLYMDDPESENGNPIATEKDI